MTTRKRRLIVRISAVVIVLLIAVWMFFIGKQHTVLLDNKTVDDIAALDLIEVTVDKQPSIEITKRMRDQAIVTGQKHTLTIVYTDDSGNEIVLEKDISIPLGENMVLVSLPVLIANPDAPQEDWLEPFESLAVTYDTGSDEVVLTEEASLMSDF